MVVKYGEKVSLLPRRADEECSRSCARMRLMRRSIVPQRLERTTEERVCCSGRNGELQPQYCI